MSFDDLMNDWLAEIAKVKAQAVVLSSQLRSGRTQILATDLKTLKDSMETIGTPAKHLANLILESLGNVIRRSQMTHEVWASTC